MLYSIDLKLYIRVYCSLKCFNYLLNIDLLSFIVTGPPLLPKILLLVVCPLDKSSLILCHIDKLTIMYTNIRNVP